MAPPKEVEQEFDRWLDRYGKKWGSALLTGVRWYEKSLTGNSSQGLDVTNQETARVLEAALNGYEGEDLELMTLFLGYAGAHEADVYEVVATAREALFHAHQVEDGDEITDNVFCPTGPGGGVDPTCKPGGKAGPGTKLRTQKTLRLRTGQSSPLTPPPPAAPTPPPPKVPPPPPPKTAPSPTAGLDDLSERTKARNRTPKQLNEGVGRELRLSRKLAMPDKGISAPDAVEAVRDYTSDDHYKAANRSLREGKDFGDIPPPSLGVLNEMTKQELKKPVMTYRGIDEKVFKAHYEGLKPGAEVVAKGFVSTSLRADKATSFGEVVLEIKARRGLYVNDYSEFKDEHELVQAHGTRYKFVGMEDNVSIKGEPYRVVKMEEL